jgi:hypothetical protein
MEGPEMEMVEIKSRLVFETRPPMLEAEIQHKETQRLDA